MDKRKVEVFTGVSWEEIEFEHLKTGDMFRMFEPDGASVEDDEGNRIFIAVSEPFLTDENIWAVKVKSSTSSF